MDSFSLRTFNNLSTVVPQNPAVRNTLHCELSENGAIAGHAVTTGWERAGESIFKERDNLDANSLHTDCSDGYGMLGPRLITLV